MRTKPYRPTPIESPELQLDRRRLRIERLLRWTAFLAKYPARQEILDWTERMTAAQGPQVQVHENILPWPIALYVVRYGEAEGWWPAQLTDDDVRRALAWESGERPPKYVRRVSVAPVEG